jgi:O-antigen/teichoic acid export membrane protein
MSAATVQLVPVVLLELLGASGAGLYALAARVVRGPLAVLSTSMSTLVRSEAAIHFERHGSLHSLLASAVIGPALFAGGPMLALLLFGPHLFAFVFGEAWREAGRVAQVLSPGLFLEFVAMPVGAFFLVTENQRRLLQLRVFGAIAVGVAFVASMAYGPNLIDTAILMSVALALANGAVLVAARTSAREAAWHELPRPRGSDAA